MAYKTRPAYDVIVTGGGPAGIAAAIAAARNGARTLLVEQASFLGGCLTLGLPILTFHNQRGVQILNGIAQELVDRAVEMGGSPGHVDTLGGSMRTFTVIDAEIMKYLAQEIVLEAGAEILLHAFATDVLTDGTQVAGVVVSGKGGQEILPASVVIDCSGDADIAARAGAPFAKGRESDGQMQAVTTMFNLTHVNPEVLPEYFTNWITMVERPGDTEPSFLHGATHFDRWEGAVRAEKLFDDPHHAIFTIAIREGELAANTTRIPGIDATDTWELTHGEIEGRREAMRIHRFLKKHVPGFEKSALAGTGPFLGVRETRRIIGDYVLTTEDILEGRDFPDGIGRGAFPIDVHDPNGSGIHQQMIKNGGSFGIPYRVMVPQRVEQLLVAGRCVSATHEALGGVRLMGPCLAMGQAAGTAAALATANGIPLKCVEAEEVRKVLRSQGAVLEESDSPGAIPTPPGFQGPTGKVEL